MMNLRISYLICNTARSGSTLLCDALGSTGIAGQPEEYFNPLDLRVGKRAALHEPVWEEEKRVLNFPDYLARILEYGTTANGVFASKLGWGDLVELDKQLLPLPDYETLPVDGRLAKAFHNPLYLWVTRRDKVRQAVSLARAYQTDVWIRKADPDHNKLEVHFNFGFLNWCLREIVHEEASWARFFDEAGIIPLTVVYEDMVRDYESTVRRVLQYLEVSLPDGFVFPAPRLQKQADELSEAWVQRYYESDEASLARRERVRKPLRRALGLLSSIRGYIRS